MVRAFTRNIALVVGVLALNNCTNVLVQRSDVAGATEKLEKAATNVQSILTDTAKRERSAARTLMVQIYLNRISGSWGGSSNPKSKFANYVCAGIGRYEIVRVSTALFKLYAKALKEVSKETPKKFGALWKSIRKNVEAQNPLGVPEVKDDAHQVCVADVKEEVYKLARLAPEKLAETKKLQKEMVSFLSILSFARGAIGLAKSMEAAAVGALAVVEERVRVKRAIAIIKANRDNLSKALEEMGKSTALKDAHARHKMAALARPYALFQKLLNVPDTQAVEVFTIAAKVDANLTMYDTLLAQPTPKDVTKALVKAQETLTDLADGKIKAGDAWAAITAIFDAIANAKKAVEEAQSTFEKFRTGS